MVETNLIKTPDMGEVQALDFVNLFSDKLDKLKEALGITRYQPMNIGNKIQTYKYTVTRADGDAAQGIVAEGEDIPLTHVSRAKDREFEVGFKKYRKAVTIEEVQRIGYEMAANESDRRVLAEIQKDIRTSFFTFLGTAPNDLGEVTDLQAAAGKAWGALSEVFDDEEMGTLIFINPLDAGDYIATSTITNGASVGFGMNLLEGFTGATLISNKSVPRGTFYATVKDNINLMYLNTTGEAAKIFHNKQVTNDALGLIALVKDDNTVNLTDQSTIYTGINLFAEVTNGVVKGTLATAPKA